MVHEINEDVSMPKKRITGKRARPEMPEPSVCKRPSACIPGVCKRLSRASLLQVHIDQAEVVAPPEFPEAFPVIWLSGKIYKSKTGFRVIPNKNTKSDKHIKCIDEKEGFQRATDFIAEAHVTDV